MPVAILTPAAQDGRVAATVLARAGFASRVCPDMATLCAAIRDEAGAVVLAEEALMDPARARLLAAIEAQPSWSDVPVVVLTREGELSRALPPALETVAARVNVTLLERPVRVATLVTVLRSALRARRRQFDVRDHLIARTAAEEALRAARSQAEDANRAKSEFLAVMSHELRTPLNAIGGYAELIELGIHGPITDAQRAALTRIQQSQRHLLGLIAGVLDYSRLEAGAVSYRMKPVFVTEAVAEAESLVAPQLRAKGLGYAWSGAAPDLAVLADPEKLQQILLNLLGNAVKFTHERDGVPGQIEVACTVEQRTEGDHVRIQVRDTGTGIAPEKLGTIFEPFVQVDQRLTRPNEGVGLGLAISRDLARGMGGDLLAESTPGAGSTFTLVLPRA